MKLFHVKHGLTPTVVFVLFQILFSSSVWAGARETLLGMVHRPTVREFLAVIDLDQPNPFSRHPDIKHQDVRLKEINSLAPELIAQLEYAFPEATWALLGRDTTYVEIILGLFSHLVGQSNRIVRLNASTGTCSNSNEWRQLLISAGLLNSDGSYLKPFIILDPSRWMSGTFINNTTKLPYYYESQIISIMKSFYETIPNSENNQNKRSFLRKVNVVALDACEDSDKLTPITPQLDLHSFFQNTHVNEGYPHRILSTIGVFSYIASDGYRGNGNGIELGWHAKFQKMTLLPDGGCSVLPGVASKPEVREHILWFMYEAAKKILREDFYLYVLQEEFKYGLSIDRSKLIPPNMTFEELKEWLEQKTMLLRGEFPWLLKLRIKTILQNKYQILITDTNDDLKLDHLKELSLFDQSLPFRTLTWKAIKEPFFQQNTFLSVKGTLNYIDFLKTLYSNDPLDLESASKLNQDLLDPSFAFSILNRAESAEDYSLALKMTEDLKTEKAQVLELLSTRTPTLLKLVNHQDPLGQQLFVRHLKILSPEERIPFLNLHTHQTLYSHKDVDSYLRLLKIYRSLSSRRDFNHLIYTQLKKFFSLLPNENQVNELLSLVRKDGALYQHIKALRTEEVYVEN